MKSPRRKLAWVLAALGGVVVLLIGGFVVYHLPMFTERDTRPYCNKQIMSAFHIWTEFYKTDLYPNVNGSSQESLHAIVAEMNTTKHEEIYSYVPGLKKDDPADLVLLYSKWPTRFVWHADAPTLFREKRWIVVPPDFSGHRGELSDWVTTAELRTRLQKTLDFLKAEHRTNWQQVVEEHTAFLKRLPD